MHSGKNLAVLGIQNFKEDVLIDEQMASLARLLPSPLEPLAINNTKFANSLFRGLRFFTERSGQWVLFVNNTEVAVKLQSDQQVSLSGDIIKEKSNWKTRVAYQVVIEMNLKGFNDR